jgi:hypothetical protein
MNEEDVKITEVLSVAGLPSIGGGQAPVMRDEETALV